MKKKGVGLFSRPVIGLAGGGTCPLIVRANVLEQRKVIVAVSTRPARELPRPVTPRQISARRGSSLPWSLAIRELKTRVEVQHMEAERCLGACVCVEWGKMRGG